MSHLRAIDGGAENAELDNGLGALTVQIMRVVSAMVDHADHDNMRGVRASLRDLENAAAAVRDVVGPPGGDLQAS